LSEYKAKKKKDPPTPQPHGVIAESTGTPKPNLDILLKSVLEIAPGPNEATKYERAVEALLSALFYPRLVDPIRQEEIHDGRKRIDISFTNTADKEDFFYWLAINYPAANVVAECKNYSRPIANPEFDQISGRFSPSRGKVGLLVYRQYENKSKIFDSCRDTARDDRGFILALDDDDLGLLVSEAKTLGGSSPIGGLLHQRFKALIA
jgi:hypothetical protein